MKRWVKHGVAEKHGDMWEAEPEVALGTSDDGS